MDGFTAWRLRARCSLLALAALSFVGGSVARADLTLSLRSVTPSSEGEAPAGEGDGSDFTLGPELPTNLGSFNFMINAGGTLAGNAPALAAFQRAANQWKSWISDAITVNINADLAGLGPGTIASTSSVMLQGGYPLVRNQMALDAADEIDDGIVAFLPATPLFDLPPGFGLRGSTFVNEAVLITKANAKALGFAGLDAAFGANDGAITFSTSFSFDFDRSDGIGAGLTDFESAAAHEIGHVLGFISDVEFVDFVKNLNATSQDVQPTPLDMFRFDNGTAADPETTAQFLTFHRSMETNNAAMFDQISASFGGATEALMSTGQNTGDGNQASHWKNDQITGILLGMMDPSLAPGQIFPLSANDLRAFDLIGYEISQIPEAGAWLFGTVATCVGGLSIAWQRRRRG